MIGLACTIGQLAATVAEGQETQLAGQGNNLSDLPPHQEERAPQISKARSLDGLWPLVWSSSRSQEAARSRGNFIQTDKLEARSISSEIREKMKT